MRISRNRNADEIEPQLQVVDETAINRSFDQLMRRLEETPHELALEDLQDDYAIEGFHIEQLTAAEVRRLHTDIIEKYKVRRLKRNWCENELKLFVWVLFHFEAVSGCKLASFKPENWQCISSIFVNKRVEDCKFEWLSLMKVGPPNEQWSEEEDALLQEIIKKQQLENKWNDVAKQLYRESAQRFFRRPKQCRERWRNYLDPDISKGEWTAAEDSILLEYVLEIGKKWSAIAKCIRKRTEHAVKNRFKSLIKKYRKDNPKKSKKGKGTDSESQIIKFILKSIEHSEPESEVSLAQQNPPERKKQRSSRSKATKAPVASKPQTKPQPLSQPQPQVAKEELPKPPTFREEFQQKFSALMHTPRDLSKQDFGGTELQWMCSPLTPFNYLDNNKQFGSLIFVASPRSTISPRFRSIGWSDFGDKDHFI